MNVEPLSISGLLLLTPRQFRDERGYFSERFKREVWNQILPGSKPFVQDNFSFSKPGVVRGLHYQFTPDQGKLVTCVQGSVLDVAVDIRRDSPTLGKHVAVELSAENLRWLWIPAGFAHGFAVISQAGASLLYKVDAPYSPKTEGAIKWNDPDLSIKWPETATTVSQKDLDAPSFKQYLDN